LKQVCPHDGRAASPGIDVLAGLAEVVLVVEIRVLVDDVVFIIVVDA
jgi:hypothetical protein